MKLKRIIFVLPFLLLGCLEAKVDSGHVAPSSEPAIIAPVPPVSVVIVVEPALAPIVEPAMVNIPGGRFVMGDQAKSGESDELPAHIVNLAPFAIGKYEVTFQEFMVFCEESNHPLPDDEGFGKGNRPVINITYTDALKYCLWLSKRTGKKYSLPSEAQWEYAARAGAVTLFSNGNKPELLCKTGNIADISASSSKPHWQVTSCSDGVTYTAAVGQYAPNAFGIYDMHGNVWEWTRDCYTPSYNGAPENGIPGTEEQCRNRVIRGGSFQQPAQNARLSNREALAVDSKNRQVGFRLVLNK